MSFELNPITGKLDLIGTPVDISGLLPYTDGTSNVSFNHTLTVGGVITAQGDSHLTAQVLVHNTTAAEWSQVLANSPGVNMYWYSFGSSYGTAGRFRAAAGVFDSDGAGGLNLSASNVAGALRFYTAGDNLRMTIDANGYLGINNVSPAQSLDIGKGHFRFSYVTNPGACLAAVNVTAGNLNGAYLYYVSYVTATGESNMGVASNSVSPANQKVDLTNIPISSDSTVIHRKLYRTKAGGISAYFLYEINDNSTTTYTDNASDTSITTRYDGSNTTAGKIYANAISAVHFSDSGKVCFNGTAQDSQGLTLNYTHDGTKFPLSSQYCMRIGASYGTNSTIVGGDFRGLSFEPSKTGTGRFQGTTLGIRVLGGVNSASQSDYVYGFYTGWGTVTGATILGSYAFAVEHRAQSGVINNHYCFYADDTSTEATNPWGVYITGAIKNYFGGSAGLGVSPTARLHIAAGTAAVGTAPLKLTSGVSLTSPEAGALEFTTNAFYLTTTTGPTREQIATNANTITLTNKRVTPRILSAPSYTTDTGTSLNCDTLDQFIVTAQAGNLKLNNPTGTPTDGQKLLVAITGTAARALTYDTQFEASTVALPATTATTARLNIDFIWRADTSHWVCVAVG